MSLTRNVLILSAEDVNLIAEACSFMVDQLEGTGYGLKRRLEIADLGTDIMAAHEIRYTEEES